MKRTSKHRELLVGAHGVREPCTRCLRLGSSSITLHYYCSLLLFFTAALYCCMWLGSSPMTLHFGDRHGSLYRPLLSLSPESHCLVQCFCHDEILETYKNNNKYSDEILEANVKG